jgi:hypothetical protein
MFNIIWQGGVSKYVVSSEMNVIVIKTASLLYEIIRHFEYVMLVLRHECIVYVCVCVCLTGTAQICWLEASTELRYKQPCHLQVCFALSYLFLLQQHLSFPGFTSECCVVTLVIYHLGIWRTLSLQGPKLFLVRFIYRVGTDNGNGAVKISVAMIYLVSNQIQFKLQLNYWLNLCDYFRHVCHQIGYNHFLPSPFKFTVYDNYFT